MWCIIVGYDNGRDKEVYGPYKTLEEAHDALPMCVCRAHGDEGDIVKLLRPQTTNDKH